MTDPIQSIKAAAEAATEEPWEVSGKDMSLMPCIFKKGTSDFVAKAYGEKNARFIALSRTAVPALIKMVENRDEALEVAEDMFKEVLCDTPVTGPNGYGYACEKYKASIDKILEGAE